MFNKLDNQVTPPEPSCPWWHHIPLALFIIILILVAVLN